MFKIVVNDRYEPRELSNFNNFSLTLNYDSICDSFGFAWMFNPENKDHKELLCLSHFHECDVYYNNKLLIAGNIINNAFNHGATKALAEIGGYSRPGVLDDSCVPIGNYPLQTNGLTIEQVAHKLCGPYKIGISIDSAVKLRMQSIVNEKDDIQPTDTIKSYLQKITDSQRIVMSHTADGKLLFTEAKINSRPLFDFDLSTGSIPGYSFDLNYNGQAMHRTITVMQQADDEGGHGGQYTVINPYVIGSYPKSKTVTVSAGIADDIKKAARQELSKELQELTLNVEISNWQVGDKMILPNNILSIIDPYLYIWKKSNFFIKSVTYTGDENGVKCVLSCVLPDVFTDSEVVSIFKNINVHDKKNH